MSCELTSQEVAIAEQLDVGVDASALVGASRALVEAEPFRERRWALLMRTLYLAGRQHDALQAFQRARVLLRDELGLSPGAELLAIERSILNQEPSLDPPATPPGWSPIRSRDGLALIGRTMTSRCVTSLLDEQRLVTVVGLGGVGKTSLAPHVAAGWPEHRCRPAPRSTTRPGSIETVARDPANRRRRAPGTPSPAGPRLAPTCLLVLDNCEHVRDAATEVADVVLGTGDGPTVLATSRVPLGHPDESGLPPRPLCPG